MARGAIRPHDRRMSNEPMPVLFLSHGAPLLARSDNAATAAWRDLARTMPKPKVVLVASAHHDAAGPALTTHPAPETIHDFYGFPPELYALRYPAPGAPDTAASVIDLLRSAGFDARPDPQRGIDHGVWVPLLRLNPEADVPVLSMSIDSRRDAAWHDRLGRALSPLRREGVLIVGSGSLTHNLRALDGHAAPGTSTPQARAFADWVLDALAHGQPERLLDWPSAPQARFNHPSPEHFLPLLVALGAADTNRAPEIHAATWEYGALTQHAMCWRH